MACGNASKVCEDSCSSGTTENRRRSVMQWLQSRVAKLGIFQRSCSPGDLAAGLLLVFKVELPDHAVKIGSQLSKVLQRRH